jgi:hypothetical protein
MLIPEAEKGGVVEPGSLEKKHLLTTHLSHLGPRSAHHMSSKKGEGQGLSINNPINSALRQRAFWNFPFAPFFVSSTPQQVLRWTVQCLLQPTQLLFIQQPSSPLTLSQIPDLLMSRPAIPSCSMKPKTASPPFRGPRPGTESAV